MLRVFGSHTLSNSGYRGVVAHVGGGANGLGLNHGSEGDQSIAVCSQVAK